MVRNGSKVYSTQWYYDGWVLGKWMHTSKCMICILTSRMGSNNSFKDLQSIWKINWYMDYYIHLRNNQWTKLCKATWSLYILAKEHLQAFTECSRISVRRARAPSAITRDSLQVLCVWGGHTLSRLLHIECLIKVSLVQVTRLHFFMYSALSKPNYDYKLFTSFLF